MARVDVEDEEGPEVGKSVAWRLRIGGGDLRVVGAESREKTGGLPGEPVITLHHVRSLRTRCTSSNTPFSTAQLDLLLH